MKWIVSLLLVLFSTTCLAESDEHLNLQATSFRNLPGWKSDQQQQAFEAFLKSCRIFTDNKVVGSPVIPLHQQQWATICHAATKVHPVTQRSARSFFEKWFQPVAISKNHNPMGTFTGYYLPTIPARLHQEGAFNVPLYTKPRDLISVNLGDFNPALAGKTLVGKLVGSRLVPYNTPREKINQGALAGRSKIIAWVNPVDRFFLQVQGSGAIQFDDGSTLFVSFDGKNGSPYSSIGRILVENNVLQLEQASMQNIKNWLLLHPRIGQKLMNQDASFVFFKPIKSSSAFGTHSIPLTAERSLAVDQEIIPIGIPMWLSTKMPNPKHTQQPEPFQHLMVSQDTGGAIRGTIRGDVFWGAGDRAEIIAGHMNSPGRYWLLLPRA